MLKIVFAVVLLYVLFLSFENQIFTAYFLRTISHNLYLVRTNFSKVLNINAL